MSKPAILLFVDWYRPGFKGGGPVRSMINLVEHLGDRADLHIVTADTDYASTAPYPGIVPDRWTTLPTGEQVWYASAKGRTRAVWKQLLHARPWSVVYVNGMFSPWYSIMPLWLMNGSRQRRIVAPRGMLLPGPMSQGALKKHAYLALARGMGLFTNVEFQATSADEVLSVRRLVNRYATVHEVGNLARRSDGGSVPKRTKSAGEARLIDVVRIATEKNVHLIIEAMRGVKGRITLDLYGPVFHEAYWEQCKAAMATLPPEARVHYHGAVPSGEVPQLMAGDHHALCMPNEGDNFGHTMLEALSAGLPLLISDRTPWRNLRERRAGWDLPLEQGAAPFTAAMQQLVDMEQEAYDALVSGAFAIGNDYLNDPVPVEDTATMLGLGGPDVARTR